jgi:uncharacterized protein YdbL (DUF1318 family)
MKLSIAKLWQAALRSGKYKQGHGKLCTVKERKCFHCCLGVLCELAYQAGIVKRKTIKLSFETIREYGDDNETDYLPTKVMEWAGIREVDLAINDDEDHGYRDLAHKNDNQHWTFEQIAEEIKAKYKNY